MRELESSGIPNLFIVGAPKAGTSALADLLGRHEEIFCELKEPRFFDAPVYYDDPTDYPISSERAYLKLFRSKRAKNSMYRLDASTFVMYRPEAIDQILRLCPNAIFIIVLRDPIEASQSMFRQRLKYSSKEMREISDQFDECWAHVELRRNGLGFPKGCRNSFLFRYDELYRYEKYLPALREKIPIKQLIILNYENLVNRPEDVLRRVGDVLGLNLNELGGLRTINPPRPVRKTWITQTIEKCKIFVLLRTRAFRRQFGLYGKRVGFIKRTPLSAARGPGEYGNLASDTTLASMRITFAGTYDYISTLPDSECSGGSVQDF